MAYRYREKFDYRGYRFIRDKKSVLVHAISYGRRLPDGEVAHYDRRINAYLDAVLSRTAGDSIYAQALTRTDFPDLTSEPIYKYISDATWEYIRHGSFQFGTAQYYRTTPNINIQDQREGTSTIHLASGTNQLHVTLTSGFNCAIFCGTAHIEGPDHELMLSRFGRKRLKIEPVGDFLACVGRLIGSFRAHVFDVVYTDLKNYAAELEGVERFYSITGGGALTNSALREINKVFFETFDEHGFMPSLFAKPKWYAQEHERRIIFEMRDDLRKPTIVVKNKSLLDFITLIDTA
jgi:hypothetical protein